MVNGTNKSGGNVAYNAANIEKKKGGYSGCAANAAEYREQAGGNVAYNAANIEKKKGGYSNRKTKKGGNLAQDVSNLLVPFGLILAKESLQAFLKKDKASSAMKSKKPSVKKVSLSKK
jgi:hypothetical protein